MKQQTSPLKAIRAHCLQCAMSSFEVKMCHLEDCPLHPFRFGHNPFSKRTLTEEQRQAAAERMAAVRAAIKTEGERDGDG